MNEKADNHITVKVSHLESHTEDASSAKIPAQPLFKRCRIHFHHKRKRLADPDGISHKSLIDGLTASGVFPDDSAKYIKEISITQEISKVEETIIEITEV